VVLNGRLAKQGGCYARSGGYQTKKWRDAFNSRPTLDAATPAKSWKVHTSSLKRKFGREDRASSAWERAPYGRECSGHEKPSSRGCFELITRKPIILHIMTSRRTTSRLAATRVYAFDLVSSIWTPVV
jgi:hypothetical protein